jgi:DnaJ homologue, subfamily C, member 28, conserved domain
MADRIPKPQLNWESLAEQRIREAQAEGEFDNLPGFGQPIPGIDQPHDELWWVKEKLKREQLSRLPPALELRRDLEKLQERLGTIETEYQVRHEVASLNERIRKASLGPVWGPPVDVLSLDVGEVVQQWRAVKVRPA